MTKLFVIGATLAVAVSFFYTRQAKPVPFIPDFERVHNAFGCLGTTCAPRNGVRFVGSSGVKSWLGSAATWTLE